MMLCLSSVNMGVSQNEGLPYWGSHNKDYSILGSILGSPYFGKLPYNPYITQFPFHFPFSFPFDSPLLGPLHTMEG